MIYATDGTGGGETKPGRATEREKGIEMGWHLMALEYDVACVTCDEISCAKGLG